MKKALFMSSLLSLSLIFGCAPKTEMNKPVKVYAPYPYTEEEWSPPSFEKELKEIEEMVSSMIGGKKEERGSAIFHNLYNGKGGGSIWE